MIRPNLIRLGLPDRNNLTSWENVEYSLYCLEDEQFDLLSPEETQAQNQAEQFLKEIEDPILLEMEKAFQSGDDKSLETLMTSLDNM